MANTHHKYRRGLTSFASNNPDARQDPLFRRSFSAGMPLGPHIRPAWEQPEGDSLEWGSSSVEQSAGTQPEKRSASAEPTATKKARKVVVPSSTISEVASAATSSAAAAVFKGLKGVGRLFGGSNLKDLVVANPKYVPNPKYSAYTAETTAAATEGGVSLTNYDNDMRTSRRAPKKLARCALLR